MHENIVAAPELAGEGLQKIEWVRRNMPILRKIQSEFEKEQPFAQTVALSRIQIGSSAESAYSCGPIQSFADLLLPVQEPQRYFHASLSLFFMFWIVLKSSPIL